MTYSRLADRSARLGAALTSLGVAGGRPAAMYAPNSHHWVEFDVACGRWGLTRLGLGARLHPAEASDAITRFGAAVVITTPALAKRLRDVGTAAPIVVIGDQYEQLLGRGQSVGPVQHVAPDTPYLIGLTSGSTGRPKGAVQTQAGRAAALVNQLGLTRLGRASRALHFLSISNAGLMAITTLVAGGCNVVTNETTAEGLIALVRHHRITHLTGVPFVAERLLAAPTAIRAGLSELHCLMMFGSPIEPDVLRHCIEVAGQSVIYAYGSTEAPMPVTALAPAHYAGSADVEDRLLKSAGWPTPAWDVSVRSAEGQRMASGHGELLVRGTGQLIGYWGDQEASAAVLDGDGWYATGDLATIADDGLVTIEGRLREFLISGGYNVYPAEVERRLVEHPSVAEAAVVGLEDRTWGEIVAAFVVPAPQAAPSPTELVSWTRQALAAYKRPRRLVMVDELPRGPFGKVRKAELVKRFSAEPGLGLLSDD